ncbi:hypothetical protein J4448_01935 [Candidatus Woesearchaeota archaeon]|nr:hypothetical protein [Candidatus Woesearchaeota archaeon]
MEKLGISFFAMNFILLFVIIGFILIVFDLYRFAFVFELMILLVFIFLLAFAMFVIYHNEKLGWTILGAALILLLLDTFFIILLAGAFETAHITTIFFSVIGLLVILLNLRTAKSYESETEDEHKKAKNYYPYIDKMEPEEPKQELNQEIKEEIKKESEDEKASEKTEIKKAEIKIKSKKTSMPKFVASAETKKFHTVKCGWARLMKRKNKVFFNSIRRAQAAGFKAHECIN